MGTYKTTHPCLSIPCRPPRQTCAWGRASIHPYSCTLAPQRPSPPPSLMAQITFLLQDLGGSRLPSPSLRPSLSPGGLQSGPIAAFGAAASIPAPVSLPPNTLSSAPSASPLLLGAPPHCRPLPPLSVPNLVGFTPSPSEGPRFPGTPPLPLVLLPWVSPSLAPPLLPTSCPPIPPPGTKPPQFLHHRTWLAGRRPPHAGLRPELEEGGGETETRGSRTGPCRRDSPASGSAPRPAPGPKPTLPHPPRTEWERRGRAVLLGWGGGHGASGARGGQSEIWGTWSQPAPLWGVRSSPPLAPARPGRAEFDVQGPGGAIGGAGCRAQRRPPAAARGLHTRAYPVRPALAGCAPRVRPGRGCGCGARSAVRRRGRQVGPVSGRRGSESRQPDHPRLCPAGGVLPCPRGVFPPPPRYRRAARLFRWVLIALSLQLPRSPDLVSPPGLTSSAHPPPWPKSSSQ